MTDGDELTKKVSSPRGTTDTSMLSAGDRSLRDVESTEPGGGIFDSVGSRYTSENYRRAVGASYVLTVGISGIVLVALASSLMDLAIALGKTSVEIGGVLLTRGVGAGIGNLVSPDLYALVRGKMTISVALFFLAANLLVVPLVDSVGRLHLTFLSLGFLTSIIDAGCQLMTRRLHGSAAGPWLGANTVSFGLGGAFSPLVGWLTGSLVVEYSVLASVAIFIGCFLVVLPSPDVEPAPHEESIQVVPFKIPEGWSKPRSFYAANKIDFFLCGIMFWFMGGRVAATAFLRQFAHDTSGSSQRSLLIVCLWLAITLGRVIGLRDQLTLTLAPLHRHAAAVCVGGCSSMLLLLAFSRSKIMLWVTVVTFGAFTGPALGYGYDLNTRLSPNPAMSSTVAQFGITAGTSVVPFLVSLPWDLTGWAILLPLLLVVSHAIPFVLLRKIRKLPGGEPGWRRHSLDSASDGPQPAPTPTFGAPPPPPSPSAPSVPRSRAGSYFEGGDEPQQEAMTGTD